MAASVKIEFDDGSRVVSQTLEEAAGAIDDRGNVVRRGERRPLSFSFDDYYEILKTVNFIASGTFRRVALQFPDPLLREAPEVLWTLQARLRKLLAARGECEDAEQPLIFVTGDTSYGSCCVDEVAAQHLKADAIIHYGRACLSPTNSSVPVLYVFGREEVDVEDLAAMLLSGPLSTPTKAPVLLLYDVTYAYAISDLVKTLGDEATRDGKLVIGLPTTDVDSSVEKRSMAEGVRRVREGCKCGAISAGLSARQVKPSDGSPGDERKGCSSLGVGACDDANAVGVDGQKDRSGSQENGPAATTSGEGALSSQCSESTAGTAGTTDIGGGVTAADCSSSTSTPTCGKVEDLPSVSGGTAATGSSSEASLVVSRTRLRIGGLVVDLGSEDALRRHTLVFVGGEGRQLSNVLLRCTGCVDRLRYDPTLPPGQRVIQDAKKGNRDLMRRVRRIAVPKNGRLPPLPLAPKIQQASRCTTADHATRESTLALSDTGRYYLVQRAKEAGVVGIVVGTLGVQRYGDVVRSLRKMVEDAGRKAYTLAVGKVNVAKLANFAEVEVFCLVACAENTLLNSKEFHAPVVTPLELEVALGKREWDGFYSTDFDDLGETSMPSKSNVGDAVITDGSALNSLTLGAKCPDHANDLDKDDLPFFSLVTGSFKNNPGVSRRVAHVEHDKDGESGGSGALIRLGNRSLIEWSSPAADFLDQRKYKGLEALVGQTEVKPATEGQSGIASDYGGV